MKKPKKSLGQNFLIDQNVIKKIINQTNIKGENIVEIGPGYGSLTDHIIRKKPKKLIIIEKDLDIYKFLKNKFKDEKKIEIINNDALKYDFSKLKNIKIISNLPYNISTKIIMKLIFFNKNIKNIICMIQKELAIKFDYRKEKINKYKFIIKICSDYEILFDVSNKVFFPKPKVQSKIVEFKLKNNNIEQKKLLNFTNIIFGHKRKTIKNKITNISSINKEIQNKRVEELNFNEILEIYKFF
tara:strand:- start:2149 stop:2874 length:726 start_codon:yes stop_codon:yes gene_type:complete